MMIQRICRFTLIGENDLCVEIFIGYAGWLG